MLWQQWIFQALGVVSHISVPVFTLGCDSGMDAPADDTGDAEICGERAANLYWLALLLCGDSGRSADIALEAIDSGRVGTSYFSAWKVARLRTSVIVQALAGARCELAESMRRMETRDTEQTNPPIRGWTPDNSCAPAELERALLAVDIFPRCVVVMSVLEGMPHARTAVLLDSGLDLVRKAQAFGLRELARNLAPNRGRAPQTRAAHSLISVSTP